MSGIAAAHISPTHRVSAVILLASALMVLSLLRHAFLYASVSLFLLIACCRGIASLEASALARAHVHIEAIGRTEGDEVLVSVVIENTTLVPIPIAEIAVDHSPHLRLVKGSKLVLACVPPRSRIAIYLSFEPRIGKHWIGPLRASVRDPLGMFRSSEFSVGSRIYVRIAPKVSEATIRRLLVRTRSSGFVRGREPGTGVEFYSVREYRPGDDLRRVDWKHFAATSRLVVKEMERESYQSVLFLVDATPRMLYGPRKNTPLEHTLRIVASLSMYLARRGDLQSVIVFQRKGLASSSLSRGRRAFNEVMHVLSSIELDTEPLDDSDRASLLMRAVRKAISMLPRERNAVFIFTSSGSREYLDALCNAITKLSSMGNIVYVVLPLVTLYQATDLPKWAKLAFTVKTYELVKLEEEFASSLRQRGAKVIIAMPQFIPATIASIIERIAS